MSPLQVFLDDARRHIQWSRARLWALRGVALVAVAALAVQLVDRWRPFASQWPVLTGVFVVGFVVAAAGWAIRRPTLAEVARSVDRRLGGQERLSTALELSAGDATIAYAHRELFDQQRADADDWASKADPRQAAPSGLPRRELAVVMAAAALAALLIVVPNASRARQQAAEEGEAAREAAAEEVAALADELSQGVPGENPARRQALVRELRQAREALLEARDVPAGVAALSRAQASLQGLADPSTEGRASAAAAAGAELAKSGAGAEAGSAMSKADAKDAEELEQLASALPSLSPEEQAAVAAQLAEAAAAAQASSPAQAQSLSKAAEALSAGQPEAAAAALATAAQEQQAEAAEKAAESLEALGASLPNLTPEQQAELAQALQQAAAAAAADPALAEQLRNAANAIREGRPGDAAAALAKAGERTEQLDAESSLDADVSRASNALQSSKAGLLSKSSPSNPPPGAQSVSCGGDMAGHDHPTESNDLFGGVATTLPAVSPPPTTGTPPDEESSVGCSGAPSDGPPMAGPPIAGAPFPGAGQMPGSGVPGGGSPGEGAGAPSQGGKGGTSGQGGEGGAGAGDDSGGDNGGNRGGGGSGARGALGQAPGLPTEKVYIPGITGPGRTQSMPGGSSTGADAPLVAYETVYSQYRSEALSQADRQLIPERLRELLRQYFQETPP